MASSAVLDALDPNFRERPHDILDALRANDPVHEEVSVDRIVLTRAQDVGSVLADRSLSVDPFTGRPTTYGRSELREEERQLTSMNLIDDPDHTRLRRLFSSAFSARAIEAMRPRIEGIARDLLRCVDGDDPFDLMSAYASPLPTLVIAEMLGVEIDSLSDFKRWSDDILIFFSPQRSEDENKRLLAAFYGLDSLLGALVACCRHKPREDLVGALVKAEADGDRLTDREIVNNCRLLLVAGNVTTADLIGNGLVALMHNPEQRSQVLANPALWPAAVEEMLRYDPPISARNRHCVDDRQIAGCPVAAGQTITAMLLAANRDPALHASPHTFDVERPRQKHFSFGGGLHFCLGASLARLEAQIGFRVLFERFPNLRLSARHELRRRAVPTFNGYEAIFVEAKREGADVGP